MFSHPVRVVARNTDCGGLEHGNQLVNKIGKPLALAGVCKRHFRNAIAIVSGRCEPCAVDQCIQTGEVIDGQTVNMARIIFSEVTLKLFHQFQHPINRPFAFQSKVNRIFQTSVRKHLAVTEHDFHRLQRRQRRVAGNEEQLSVL